MVLEYRRLAGGVEVSLDILHLMAAGQ